MISMVYKYIFWVIQTFYSSLQNTTEDGLTSSKKKLEEALEENKKIVRNAEIGKKIMRVD